jgi:hypothetical protein
VFVAYFLYHSFTYLVILHPFCLCSVSSKPLYLFLDSLSLQYIWQWFCQMFYAKIILLNCKAWIIMLGSIRWTNHTTLYYLWNQYLANMNVLTQQSWKGVLNREQFNNLSSSPLAFCQVQKPGHFWHFFYVTQTRFQARNFIIHKWLCKPVLGCGPCRKLGEPEQGSGMGFKVLNI